jgi:type II secretory pathway component HofQ
MALGDLTKQLASQAIRNAVNPPAAPPRPDNSGTAMLAQVQAMQKALKEDEELIVLFHAGGETVRVLEFFFPILAGGRAHRHR